MPRLFISHSRRDVRFVVRRLKPLFDLCGAVSWCSSTDIRAGVDWHRQICAALAHCDLFLVLLSPDARDSQWVQAETHWAIEHMPRRVIPVMVRSCDPAALHLRLATIQYVDFRRESDAAAQELMRLIKQATAPVGAVVAPPAATGEGHGAEPTTIIGGAGTAELTLAVMTSAGQRFETRLVVRQWAVLGRGDDADLRIADNSVSRQHARISAGSLAGQTTLVLTDLDSANGTALNGRPVVAGATIASGDVIALGRARLTVLRVQDAAGDPASDQS